MQLWPFRHLRLVEPPPEPRNIPVLAPEILEALEAGADAAVESLYQARLELRAERLRLQSFYD